MRPDTERWLAETADPEYLPRLRAALKALSISQAEFARRCGRSASWIGQVLRGHYPHYDAGGCPKGVWERAQPILSAAARAAVGGE
jgi:hypothetical protein